MYKNLNEAASDPIFGLVEAHNKDPRENKVNLTIGVLIDEEGQVCAPNAVKDAMQMVVKTCQDKPNYLGMSGIKNYCDLAAKLLFRDSYSEEKIISLQSIGGTGALRIIADFIKNNLAKDSSPEIFVSKPTWGNHKDVFATSGFKVSEYNYYSSETKAFDQKACLESLTTIAKGSYVLLHASSHNPSGCDPSAEDWQKIIKIIQEKELVAIVDCAYQGLGQGFAEDVFSITELMKTGVEFFVAQSFSKSLGLYSQRTGAAHFIIADPQSRKAVASQAALCVRKMYSNPPAFGALTAEKVLGDKELRTRWEGEISSMRERLIGLRSELVNLLNDHNLGQDFGFINKQVGLFAYTGLNQKQAEYARNEEAVYLLNSGRICVAALNKNNIQRVASVLASSFKIK